MKKLLLFLSLILASATVCASDIEAFFQAQKGDWSLVSGWSKDIADDGSTRSENTTVTSIQAVLFQDAKWKFLRDFCNRTETAEFCGQSERVFRIDGENLFLIDEDHHTTTKVEVLYSTKTELSFRLDFDGMVFIIWQKLSNDILTETTQVELKGKVISIGFLAVKKRP